jgi:hypothetical protein
MSLTGIRDEKVELSEFFLLRFAKQVTSMDRSLFRKTAFKVNKSCCYNLLYSCADKSLARSGRKQSTTTEDFDVHISYL